MGGHPSHSKANPNFDPNWKQTQPPHNGPITEGKTIIARFNACVEYFKDDTLLQYQENIPGNGPWKSVSYKEYQTICVQLAAAMEDIGMLPGDRIIMLGDGTGVWSLVAVAIQMVGASIIGVHSGFTPANTAGNYPPSSLFGQFWSWVPKVKLIPRHILAPFV